MNIGKIEPERLLTSSEVGVLLQVNTSSVKNWVNDGHIPAFRTPGGHRRIRAADLVEFLDQREMPIPKSLSRLARRRLLVVDDDPIHLGAVGRAFKRFDKRLQCELCTSGIDALLRIGAFRPHAIILDVYMNELDGLEVCRRVKANPETRHIDAILVSAHMTRALEQQGHAAGARRCMQKPIDVALVLADLAGSTRA